MLKLVLAAVAATFAVNAQAAEPTFAESCGHIDNPVRFNPTELSEHQKCWIDFYKADESAGMIGSLFWARAGDELISMPVSTLRSAGSADAAKQIVIERIIEEVVVERIVEVTVENGETIDRLRAEIRVLQPLADSVAGLQAQIDAKSREIMRLMGLPTYSDGYRNGHISIQNDVRDDINNFFGTSHATYVDAITWLSTAELEDGHRSTVTQRTGVNIFDVTGAMAGTYYNQAYLQETLRVNGMFIAANAISNELINEGYSRDTFSFRNIQSAIGSADSLNEAVRNMVEYVLDNLPTPTLSFGTITSDPLNESNLDNYDNTHGTYSGIAARVGRDGGTLTVTVSDFATNDPITTIRARTNNAADGLDRLFSRSWGGPLQAAIESVVKEAFSQGYSEGYNEGYVDGYRDGFADGQSSVTLN